MDKEEIEKFQKVRISFFKLFSNLFIVLLACFDMTKSPKYRCPKCQGELEIVEEAYKRGKFTYWKCPKCGWNNKERRLKEDI